jgi:hypothetical protein
VSGLSKAPELLVNRIQLLGHGNARGGTDEAIQES